MQETPQLPLPCRKILIDQIKRSAKTMGHTQSQKSEKFIFQSSSVKFSYSNVWVQGHITEITSDCGERILSIADSTAKACVCGMDRILEKNPFLMNTFKQG